MILKTMKSDETKGIEEKEWLEKSNLIIESVTKKNRFCIDSLNHLRNRLGMMIKIKGLDWENKEDQGEA